MSEKLATNDPELSVLTVAVATSTPFLLNETVIALPTTATAPDFTFPDTVTTGLFETNALELESLATTLSFLPTVKALAKVTAVPLEHSPPMVLVVRVYLPAMLGVAILNTPEVRSALITLEIELTPVFSCNQPTVTVQPTLTRETLIIIASPGVIVDSLEVLSSGARKAHFAYKVTFEATPGE
jgi:hypothetical protein